jgi:hypothetical protein
MSPSADHCASLSSQLKCAHLVPSKAPLPEEVIFNQKQAAAEKRRATRKAQHKKCQIVTITATRGGKRGRLASPLMKTRCPGLRGVAMWPARRLIGATCRGRPPRRLLAALKCRHRARRPDATTPLDRAHAKWFVSRERTSRWSTHVLYLVEWVLSSRRDLRPGKPIPREGRGAAGVIPSAL